jgi:hypothetical protein
MGLRRYALFSHPLELRNITATRNTYAQDLMSALLAKIGLEAYSETTCVSANDIVVTWIVPYGSLENRLANDLFV